MDKHLKSRQWIAIEHVSIADIALYSYTAHAPEGGVSLSQYSYVQDWLKRIEGLPGFMAMQKTPVGLAA